MTEKAAETLPSPNQMLSGPALQTCFSTSSNLTWLAKPKSISYPLPQNSNTQGNMKSFLHVKDKIHFEGVGNLNVKYIFSKTTIPYENPLKYPTAFDGKTSMLYMLCSGLSTCFFPSYRMLKLPSNIEQFQFK